MHGTSDARSEPVPEEAVAIIGMACRYPGESSSPTAFWNMISHGRTAHGPIPASRYNAAAWYHPDPERRGSIVAKSGYFINEAPSAFDAPFFSINTDEANTMDPMHRWMLETTYEGLENAGIPITTLAGSKTGCFVGCFTQDYSYLMNADIFQTGPYGATGMGLTMLSNRVSWFFDLYGPSLTIDTACSSSMYALHLACQSIRAGEISQAIVGGANLILYPDMFHSLSKMRMMSPDGKCHAFDDRANGYGRGEGLGVLIVKSLTAALADGDTIRAVIRATGCNQDGRTPGITVPSARAQADLILSTYAKANLPLNETTYFEAHGTGTPVGDPLELSAIGATFGAARSTDDLPIYVSSVKSNIGHTEGCSAIAGIMKAVMCIEQGLIVPHAGLERLNSRFRLAEWKIAIPRDAIAWPTPGIRRASVNSFGYGGANGHVILDDAVTYLAARGLKGNTWTWPMSPTATYVDSGFHSSDSDSDETLVHFSDPARLFVYSTFDQAGISRVIPTWTELFSKYMKKESSQGLNLSLDDLAFTLATRRTTFDYRSFAVARSIEELQGTMTAGMPKASRPVKNGQIILVFTGQGAQWPQMGLGLLRYPTFLRSLKATQAILNKLNCPWDLVEELEKSKHSNIHSAEFAQPICTAIQIALFDLLSEWGIRAKAVVGHSSGEIGAAYAAQMISHEDAVKVAFHRGIYSREAASRPEGVAGGMLAAGLTEQEAQDRISRLSSGKVVVACINSPSSVTISGDDLAIKELNIMLHAEGKFARSLKVSAAYHSHHMLPIAEDYFHSMGELESQIQAEDAPKMFSSVTGVLITSNEVDASYWVKNMVNPVRFSEALQSLLAYIPSTRGRRRTRIKYSFVVEIGPHPALKGPVAEILSSANSDTSTTYESLLSRGQADDVTALNCAGRLWAQGIEIDLKRVNLQDDQAPRRVLTDLPSYPWNHSKGFWHESEIAKAKRFKKKPRTDLLGMAVDVQNPLRPQWRQLLSVREQPWIEHHKITNTILLPAAAMLIMALEAAYEISDGTRNIKMIEFRHVKFERAFVLPLSPENAVEASLTFHPHKIDNTPVPGWWHFTVFSLLPGGEWVEHCSGVIAVQYQDDRMSGSTDSADKEWKAWTAEYEKVCSTSDRPIEKTKFYEDVATVGMNYGATFQNLSGIVAGPTCGHGIITIPDTQSSMPYMYEYPHLIHPTTLDAIFHLVFISIHAGKPSVAAVPTSIESMAIYSDLPFGAGSRYKAYSRGIKTNTRDGVASVVVSDNAWSAPKIIINNLSVRDVSDAVQAAKVDEAHQPKLITRIRWIEDVDFLQGPSGEAWLQRVCAEPAEKSLHWLRSLCHKQANLSVLICYAPEVDKNDTITFKHDHGVALIERFAPRQKQRDCFDRCTVVAETQSRLDEMKQKLEALGITTVDFRTAYPSQDLVLQGFEPASLHLVVSYGYDKLANGENANGVAQNFATVLRRNGWLMADSIFDSAMSTTTGRESATPSSDWERMLTLSSETPSSQYNRTTIYRSIPDVAFTASKDGYKALPLEQIVILMPSSPSSSLLKLGDRISEKLEARNITVKCMSLTELVVDQKNTIISLLELETPFLISMDEEKFEMLKKICTLNKYMLWINRATKDFSPATGTFRVLRTELPQIKLPQLQVSETFNNGMSGSADLLLDVFFRTVMASEENMDMEFAEKQGYIHIPRLIAEPSLDTELCISCDDPPPILSALHEPKRPLKLTVASPGDIESLVWIADTRPEKELADEEVEFKVIGVPLHAADLENSLGNTAIPVLGSEAFGIVTRVGLKVSRFKPGQMVAAIGQNMCCTLCCQHQDLVVLLSDEIATLGLAPSPLTLLTAYHIVDLAQIHHGDRILINSAGTALEETAVKLARHSGAELFISVNSFEEGGRFSKLYSIPQDHLIILTDSDLASALRLATNGHGVDVVLNNMNGMIAQESWHCLADFGRFIDYGRNGCAALPGHKGQVSYHRVDMEQLIMKRRHIVSRALVQAHRLVNEGVIGHIKNVKRFPASKATGAIEWFQENPTKDLVVLELEEHSQVPSIPSNPTLPDLDSNACYLVVGGLGGLGPGIVTTLIECGARHVVTLSRSGATTEKQKALVQGWQDIGCRVDALSCDSADSDQLRTVIERAERENWRIRGAVQAAAVLKDSPFETMSFEKWQAAIRPKIQGTQNLHDVLPRNLDFFIVLSSVATVIGNAGQANYCAGNSFQDALCEYRRSLGLKGTSISLGSMTDTGDSDIREYWTDFLIQNPHVAPVQFKERDFWSVLKACMKGVAYQGEHVHHHIITGVDDNLVRASKTNPGTAPWATDRKFELRQKPSREITNTGTGDPEHDKEVSLEMRLESAGTGSEATMAVESAIRHKIANAISVDSEQIDSEKPLHSYSVDSLRAVEMRNWMLKVLKAEISIFDILGQMPISKMAIKIVIESKLVKAEVVRQAKELDAE